MSTEDKLAYQAQSRNGAWEVQDQTGKVVMACRDERSASDYSVLLNDAYRRGYKAGYRDSKKSG